MNIKQKIGLWLGLPVLLVTAIILYTLAFMVMEYGHYLGKLFPFWIILFLPAFLTGRMIRRKTPALLTGAGIPLVISLSLYLIFFVHRSGDMRLRGWFADLWYWVIFLILLILALFWMGQWVRRKKKILRRWITFAVCTFFLFFSILQAYLFFSGFIHTVFFKLDLQDKPYDQAVKALGDFFRKHYNYLEYKGINWDSAVNEAAEKSREAKNGDEYFRIVSSLVNLLGDGHLKVHRTPSEIPEQKDIDLDVRWIKIENRWFILDVMDNSPAAQAGLARKFELLDVDGRTPEDLIAEAPDWRFNSKFNTIKGDRVGERARLVYMLRRQEGSFARFNLEDLNQERCSFDVLYERWDWPRIPYFSSRRLAGDIGYIRIARFTSDCFTLISSFDKALENLWDTQGLIIDIRSNPGGIGFITDTMLDRFCQERINYGRLVGSGKRFTNLYVMPRRPVYRHPVAVLIDEFDFSASELFAYSASEVPGVILIGRATGGVVSCPSQQKIYLPASLSLDFTFGTLTDNKGKFVVEWTGMHPDIRVSRTIEDIQKGKDRDLDVAIQWIKSRYPSLRLSKEQQKY
jgi:C-terminal processing protease CtpA/Prc